MDRRDFLRGFLSVAAGAVLVPAFAGPDSYPASLVPVEGDDPGQRVMREAWARGRPALWVEPVPMGVDDAVAEMRARKAILEMVGRPVEIRFGGRLPALPRRNRVVRRLCLEVTPA